MAFGSLFKLMHAVSGLGASLIGGVWLKNMTGLKKDLEEQKLAIRKLKYKIKELRDLVRDRKL